MAIDPYAPCPCGSGKKLKFCCSDLAGELEKVTKLITGDQPHAALKHVEQLLVKHPDRASLLDIRAMLEMSLGELDAAQETIDRMLAQNAENPAAHAQAAVLAATRGDSSGAVARLQDALELTGNEMPQRVFEAIGVVGHHLLLEGDFVAARAHLLLYAGIAPEGDNRAIELLLRLNLQGGLPLLLRDNLLLAEPPSESPQNAAVEEAWRLARRGLWRRAAEEFAKFYDSQQPEPAVVYNLALMRGWLGDRERFAEGLHEFARLDVPLDAAVEAEALAQLVDPRLVEQQLESVRTVYPLCDEDAASERLASDKRIEPYELDAENLEEDDVTRPRSTHILLDRPVPRSGAELTVEEAPNVLAFLSVYGKRTDREARLDVTTDRGAQFDDVGRLLGEILGDAVGPAGETEVVAEKSAPDESLSWRWRLPNDTTPAQRRRLLDQRRRRAILEDWTTTPRAALGGVTPREAADTPELRVPLLASVLLVEQSAVDPRERQLFDELRTQLKLPAAEAIDPATCDWDRLPLVRLPRVALADAPLDRLLHQFNLAAMAGAGVATLALAEEIVARDSLDEGVGAVYRQLVRSEPDPDRALQWAQQAKDWAQRASQPRGEWALLELEVQIERGDPLGVQAALNEIRAEHLSEPGMAEATYRLLHSVGLVGDPAAAGAMPEAAYGSPEPSGLWMPGQGAPAPIGGGKSALWTP